MLQMLERNPLSIYIFLREKIVSHRWSLIVRSEILALINIESQINFKKTFKQWVGRTEQHFLSILKQQKIFAYGNIHSCPQSPNSSIGNAHSLVDLERGHPFKRASVHTQYKGIALPPLFTTAVFLKKCINNKICPCILFVKKGVMDSPFLCRLIG